MPIPKAVARFNRYVTNPLARLLAGRLPGFGIVEHRGRKTGKTYRTPVNVFPISSGFVIALTYSSDAEWVKNVLAARGCTLRHRGRDLRLVAPTLITEAEGMVLVPGPVRMILRLIAATEFLRLQRDEGT